MKYYISYFTEKHYFYKIKLFMIICLKYCKNNLFSNYKCVLYNNVLNDQFKKLENKKI